MKDFANKSALIGNTQKRSASAVRVTTARVTPTLAPATTGRPAATPRSKPKHAPKEPLFRLPPGLARKYGKPLALLILGLLILAIAVRVAHRVELGGALHSKIESIRHTLSRHQPAEPTTVTTTATTAPKTPPAPTTNEPAFDFYTILPNRHATMMQQAPNDTPNPAQPATHITTPRTITRWAVATLANQTAAEQLRAQLLLIGLSPVINNTSAGYQIVLTLPTASALADAKSRIQQAGISGVQFQPA